MQPASNTTFKAAPPIGTRTTPAKLTGPKGSVEPRTIQDMLHTFLGELSVREKNILLRRMTHAGRPSLQKIANEQGLTRERIRQLEAIALAQLWDLLESDQGLPLAHTVAELRAHIGAAAETDSLKDWLSPDILHPELLLQLAGPYRPDGTWLVHINSHSSDPSSAIAAIKGTQMQVDAQDAENRLLEWGLPTERHIPWLTRNGTIRLLGQNLVRIGPAIRDRLVAGLTILGRPASIEEILETMNEHTSYEGANNDVPRDPRLVRTAPRMIGLADWNSPAQQGTRQHATLTRTHGVQR